jgi:hypothetical protein
MLSDIAVARNLYLEAENTGNKTQRAELYLKAAKLFLKTTASTDDERLIRSLVYLASVSAWKAGNSHLPVISTAQRPKVVDTSYGSVLNSQRIIFEAHQRRKKRAEEVRRLVLSCVNIVCFTFGMIKNLFPLCRYM